MPLPREPQRREQRRTHLDASVVPVERALLARAAALDESARARRPGDDAEYAHGYADGLADVEEHMAAEFRALAEELHWH